MTFRSAFDLENLEDLLDLAVSAERRSLAEDFNHEGSQRPGVDFLVIDLLAQQNFDWSVPQTADLLCQNFFLWSVHKFHEPEVTDFDTRVFLLFRVFSL